MIIEVWRPELEISSFNRLEVTFMKAVIEIEDLKKDIRKIIKDTMQDEMMKLRAELLHFISVEEQKEIDAIYKKPTRSIGKSIKVNI